VNFTERIFRVVNTSHSPLILKISKKVDLLSRRPDFRKNPIVAILRRLNWRLRWFITSRPWLLRLGSDLEILTPRSGPGALVYYLGYSEPEIAELLKRLLTPGMVFWDVGSHIGEFSLVASKLVGADGRVEAFEPQHDLCEFHRQNAALNGLHNIGVHENAVSDNNGIARVTLPPEPSIARLETDPNSSSRSINVRTVTLDEFLRSDARIPNVVKVDVEGAERHVLDGAMSLLALPEEHAPVWIMEFEPENTARFGYQPRNLLDIFRRHGYQVYWLHPDRRLELISNPGKATLNFVAAKRDL
jgi:FkbM family methyltransferase